MGERDVVEPLGERFGGGYTRVVGENRFPASRSEAEPERESRVFQRVSTTAGERPVSKELDDELEDVSKHVEQARASLAGSDWLRAAQALLEAQDRVGRVLREIELQRVVPSDGAGKSGDGAVS